jgi:hypothetical protein
MSSICQELFCAKGMYGSWDRLADISAAIDVIDSVKNSIAMSLDASYSGTSHKTPDTSNLVWRIAHKARELNLNSYDSTRDNNAVTRASMDILSAGEAVLKSASLASFNKNRRELLKGIQVDEEEDDIPPVGLYPNFSIPRGVAVGPGRPCRQLHPLGPYRTPTVQS